MSKVDPKHWQQVKEVFEGALRRPSEERAGFIERACAGDYPLRAEVESLLSSHEAAGSFMESPAVAGVAETLVGEPIKPLVGQQVKHYEIVALIGEGGMGEVFLAKDTILGRRVALKLLPEYVSNDADRLRRFKQEARTASTLSHPNVCVIHEIGENAEGRPFIAMEYIEGVTLRRRMTDRAMKLGNALDVAIQIADALTAAHEAGIVHRDIKPENIMIRRDGYIKVLDFGLAKLTERPELDGSPPMSTLLNSSPGTVMGTAAYMSPVQARGVAVDVRTDVWSLGVVLYEMVTGQPPFAGPTPTDIAVAIVEKEPLPISQLVSEVPAELERIVRKALRKDPEERYQIAKELAIDLRSLRRSLEIDSQLDRSIAPSLANAAQHRGTEKSATAEGQTITTNELEASRLTTAGKPLYRGAAWPTRLVIAALAAVVIAGGVFGLYKLLKNNEPLPRARFRKIDVTKLTTNGNAQFASISPDGKYVAYTKSESGKESLWLRQVKSAGNLEIVPPKEGHYLGLAFSPDGNSIYYGYATTSDNNAGEIFRLPVLGTGASAIKVNPEEGPPALSHDGKKLAFLRHSRANQGDMLLIANPDGSSEQTLMSVKWPDRLSWDWGTSPAWTEDDQNIALPLIKSDSNGYYLGILEMHLPDRAQRTIPLSSQRFEQPGQVSLLSDASGIIMSARAQGGSFVQLWHLERDGTVRAITNDLSDYLTAVLTADSSAFVTVQKQTLSNIWIAPKGETTHATKVTSGLGRYFDLCWAPDGKLIYASDASGSADIYELSQDGSDVRQLTSGVKRNYAPAVSPDNRLIVFHSNRSGVFQIWRMDRDGSNPVQLSTGNSESHWPQFSPDGKWVVYEHFESGSSATVWKVPIEGGTPVRAMEGFALRPVISPDGKWFGYWQNDGQENSRWRLAVMSFDNPKQVRTFEVGSNIHINWDTLLHWSADSWSLNYVSSRAGVDNLWAQSIEGGTPKQITNFNDSSIFAFDWSRDGNLATSRGVITSDVVLISDAGR